MTWLIASLGTSPSILTEALWYLEVDKGIPVDRMTCLATQESWKEAKTTGLFAQGGALERLRKSLGKCETWMTEGHGFSKVIADTKDPRSLSEAMAMDQAFRDTVRRAQEDETHEGPVVACISGGRKTMSSSLQQAMTFLARKQDWAFHVLLDVPEGIREQDVTGSGYGFPGDPHSKYSYVGLSVFELPLVRLREFAETKGIKLTDDDLVQKLQQAVDEARVLPKLKLNLATLELSDENRPKKKQLHLSPQHALLLAAFAVGGCPMTLEEAEPNLRKILGIWDSMRTDVHELNLAIGCWLGKVPKEFDQRRSHSKRKISPDEKSPEYFAQQMSRLKRELLKADPAYHIFSLRAHGRDGKKGFDDIVYSQRTPLIQIVLGP